MRTAGFLLGALWLAIATVPVRAEGPAPAPTPSPAPLTPPGTTTSAQLPEPAAVLAECPTTWSVLRDHCRPECNLMSLYVATGVKWPFEVYARGGPALVTGGGLLDDIVHTGFAAEFGGKVFCYDKSRRGAWTAEIGGDYLYNSGDATVPAIERLIFLEVTRIQLGQQIELVRPFLEIASIDELHRAYARLAGGREWYGGGETPDSARWFLGVDAGVRVGHAHAHLRILDRSFVPTQFEENFVIQDTDILGSTPPDNATDFIKNVFVGCNAGIMLPCCGFEFLLGGRVEYSYDWIELPGMDDDDTSLEQIKVLLTVAARF